MAKRKRTLKKQAAAEGEGAPAEATPTEEPAVAVEPAVDEEPAVEPVVEESKPKRVRYTNKQRCLVVCSRGVTARHRHLLEDLRKMLPHNKRDAKLDCKGEPRALNEIAELKSCNGTVYLEARKRNDLFMWLSRSPRGPSAKFVVHNIHTMDELRLTGNCSLGTRPLLCFDASFDAKPHLATLKAILSATFGTPRGHPKSKPFFDHTISFHLADEKIWVRHFQIVDGAINDADALKEDATSLVEIGPRFVLEPIRIFAGSFGGQTLYHDAKLELPNAMRAREKAEFGSKYAARREATEQRAEHMDANRTEPDVLKHIFDSAESEFADQ